jgi:hypothetical protein
MQTVIATKKELKKMRAMEDPFGNVNGFIPTQKVVGADSDTALALDERRSTVCLIDNRRGSMAARVISHNDLLSSEVFGDGTTITKTVRSSQIGGALVAGLALGGVGAIIGGLSGKTISSTKVSSIVLRLTVNDTNSPIHDVSFLSRETAKGTAEYKEAMQKARHWHGLIEVLIKRAETADKATVTGRHNSPQIGLGSVADELNKLAALRDSGVVTIDEFQRLKSKLLGS